MLCTLEAAGYCMQRSANSKLTVLGVAMFRTGSMCLMAAAAGIILAAPAYAVTPPIAEGTYTEQYTMSNGKVRFSPGVEVKWDCGPDCFRTGNHQYRFDPASNRWQTAPIEASATCADGSKRAGNGVWWTTDGVNFTGDWLLSDLCPEGAPSPLKSVMQRS